MKGARRLTGVAGNRVLLDTNAIIALQCENTALKNPQGTATDVFVPTIAVGEPYYCKSSNF